MPRLNRLALGGALSIRAAGIAVLLALSGTTGQGGAAQADDAATVSAAQRDARGWLVHEVTSPYQAGTTRIRVLLPDQLAEGRRYPALYLLPVEPGEESRYGDALVEARRLDLANQKQAILVAPTFAQLPWYADHPTDPAIRQETYFCNVVVPFVERTYPALAEPRGRLLVGFSKSGWGAWSLLLRHGDTFGRAVAWDAPLMMDAPGQYGSGPIFGTPENFAGYRLSELVRRRGQALGGTERLALFGYGGFRSAHHEMHALLDSLAVPHAYRDGPERKHDWHSGWLGEAVEWVLTEPRP
jgi:S-formylglutathione hydrolase FrmB